jgi:hypothetical protein
MSPVSLTVTVPDRESATQVLALVSEIHHEERRADREKHGVRERVRYGPGTLDQDVRQWLMMVPVEARREARAVAELRHETRQSIVIERDVRNRIGPRAPEAASSIRAAMEVGCPPPYEAEGPLYWMDARVAEALLFMIDPWITALEPLLQRAASEADLVPAAGGAASE